MIGPRVTNPPHSRGARGTDQAATTFPPLPDFSPPFGRHGPSGMALSGMALAPHPAGDRNSAHEPEPRAISGGPGPAPHGNRAGACHGGILYRRLDRPGGDRSRGVERLVRPGFRDLQQPRQGGDAGRCWIYPGGAWGGQRPSGDGDGGGCPGAQPGPGRGGGQRNRRSGGRQRGEARRHRLRRLGTGGSVAGGGAPSS